MKTESTIIQTAEFNPKIKGYFLVYVAFFLTISVAGIPLLIFWFLGIGQYMGRRFYKGLKCELTTRHLKFKKGVLFKVDKTIPLENIQDLTFIQNPLLNVFDLRILKIETAGQSNPQGSDMKLVGIVDTESFKEKVLLQRELLKNEERSERPSATNNEQVIGLLTEIRDLLKER
ncbi:MAG: PH domain-containing protein [Cytophagales bacterium]|nr:PH domain-containing protein [Cytophagales bacterium]